MNLTGIASIVNELYYFMVALGYMLMIGLTIAAVRRFVWSSMLGGMNQMGTRNFTSEGFSYLFGALITGQFLWLGNAAMSDLFGAQNYSWTPITETNNSLKFVGQFLTNAFTLIGMALAYNAASSAKHIGDGQATIGGILIKLLIAVLCTRLEWLSNTISTYIPFNPLGLFFNSSVITIN